MSCRDVFRMSEVVIGHSYVERSTVFFTQESYNTIQILHPDEGRRLQLPTQLGAIINDLPVFRAWRRP